MNRFKIVSKTWVIVCDGAKALFLRHDGDAQFLNLVEIRSFHEALKATHDLGTDHPGRVFASQDGTRSSVETADLHHKAEEAFIVRVADQLDEYARSGAIAQFVLIAPAKTLGFLRRHMTPAAQAAMKGVVNKDLTKLPIGEIEAHLQRQTEA